MNQDPDVAIGPGEPPPIRKVPPVAVLRWIRLGWNDLRRTGWPSLLHGLLLTIASLVIVEITLLFWPLLPGAVSGFLFVGPILSTGLFALSKQLELGKRPRTKDAVDAWQRGGRYLLYLGLLLVLAATLWVGITKLIFYFFVEAEIERPIDFLRYVVLQGNDTFFEWTLLAGLVIALMFSLTVVSVQLLVDRDVTTKQALITSLRTVGENPITMFAWALFLLLATTLSIATFMLGFLLLYPLMGHASWHAYRELVDAGDLPKRSGSE
ncbi:MAG: DUF2189 domain-containing protein [Thiohalomonadales bacterium]|nr:DUF2189 domain-containing protein [Thiohalomonadales bacterium]